MIEAQIAIVSDIHLTSWDEEKALILDKMLCELKVSHLVLLGDIFDFFFAESKFFQKKYERFFSALKNLSAKGCKIFFVQGNHEFALEKLNRKEISVVCERDFLLELEDSKIAFTHGDFLIAPWHYSLYLSFIRSSFTTIFVKYFVPHKILDLFCNWLAAKSRNNSARRKIPHKRILKSAKAWLKQKNCSFGVVGHFHVPYNYRSKNAEQILGLSSWDNPNILLFTKGIFKRYYLSLENGELKIGNAISL